MKKQLDSTDLDNSKFTIYQINGDVYHVNEWYTLRGVEQCYSYVRYDTMGIVLLHIVTKDVSHVLIPWSSISAIIV